MASPGLISSLGKLPTFPLIQNLRNSYAKIATLIIFTSLSAVCCRAYADQFSLAKFHSLWMAMGTLMNLTTAGGLVVMSRTEYH